MSNPTATPPTSPPGGGTGHTWTPRLILFVFALITLLAIAIAVVVVSLASGNSGNGAPPSLPTSASASASASGSPTPSPKMTSATATASPSAPVAVKPLRKGEVRVAKCTVSPAPKPGAKVTVTLQIEADKAGTVGLSAGTYLKGGDGSDLGEDDDTGDDPNHRLNAGGQSVPIEYNVPGSLDGGTYQISSELWRADEIGTGNTFTDRVCATMTVR